jgi:hypothetical protein
MAKVHQALTEAGIEAENLQGSTFQRTRTLSKFQDEPGAGKCPKVLLLLINDKRFGSVPRPPPPPPLSNPPFFFSLK